VLAGTPESKPGAGASLFIGVNPINGTPGALYLDTSFFLHDLERVGSNVDELPASLVESDGSLEVNWLALTPLNVGNRLGAI
jgi:hypothetical protein